MKKIRIISKVNLDLKMLPFTNTLGIVFLVNVVKRKIKEFSKGQYLKL